MKNQVFMSPNNGVLCVGIPLFKIVEDDTLSRVDGYIIAFNQSKPLAYVLSIEYEGKDVCTLASSEWVDGKLVPLGDL